jgi:hypothetical protein
MLLVVMLLGIVLCTSTPALAGNGTAFRTEQACLQGIDSAQIYMPSAMANRNAASTPSNGYRHAGVTGRVCVLEHTSMTGSANGETRGWWWVVIDGGNLMVSADGRSWRDSRCENAIRRIAQRPQEVATVVADCVNCNQPVVVAPPPPLPPAPQAGTWTPAPAAGTWVPAQQPVQQVAVAPRSRFYRGEAPMQFTVPQYAVSVYNQAQQAQTPPFGGETKPPLEEPTRIDDGFGGVTNPFLPPPVQNDFGGNTGLPGPLPGPNGNGFGGNTGLPAPVFGGGSTGLPNPNGFGGTTGLPGPINNGNDFGNFSGNTGLPAPVNNGGNFGGTFTGTTGLPAPTGGNVFTGNTFVGTNVFGGNTF